MAATRLGVGMIGYGYIARVHTYAHTSLRFFYDPMPFESRLVCACARRIESVFDAITRGGYEYATTSPGDVFADPTVSVVHICTPNDTHEPYAVEALRAGKHVYCEKPLARNLDEARRMRDVAAASGLVHQVAFNYRFVPAIMRAKQLVDDGFLGDVLSFRATYLHSGYVDPARPMSWRLDRERSGGGALHDLGSHAVDLVRHLLGNARRVMASLPTLIRERPSGSDGSMSPVEVDDLALMQVELESGAVGTVEASRVATGSTDDLTIEVHGTHGAIRFRLADPNWLEVFDERAAGEPIGGIRGYTRVQVVQAYPPPSAFPSPKASVGWLRFHVASLFDFLTNVVEGRVGSPSFDDGFAVQAVLEAAQQSHASGAWADVAAQ